MLREEYDSIAAAVDIRCPSLVIHGTRDRIIPIAHGEHVAAALAPRSRWVAVEGAGHNELMAVETVWRELGGFLDSIR